MSTPQNPNEPDNGQAQDQNPADPIPNGQEPGFGEPGQEQPTVQDPQAGFQQGTYDPNAHGSYQPGAAQPDYDQPGQTAQNLGYDQPGQTAQNPGYDQPGAHSQPGAYSQPGPYSQPGAYQPGAAYPQGYPQAAYGQPHGATTGEKGFFKSLFDIRFDSFIAVKWAGFIYIIAIIVAALSYLGTIVAGISAGIAAGSAASYFTDGPSFNVLPLILSILFGWIIPALWVIGVRLVLELIVSNIKTAENTKRIADSVAR
ncbi:DUF4282 domain-containing protein [Brevibacterium renqingii]|uniref:DUF4282 domain-containing protein n=1 Tax=Brevibacterium renqingii TaxID=2776916 RepID=UPI001AE0A5DC|nr:DUF4282 domain-containing protein [Brevibacterium renqingii]